MTRRVVITGMGVVAPNGVGLSAFETAVRAGESGVRFIQELADRNFACQLGAVPPLEASHLQVLTTLERKTLEASGIIYGLLAAVEAWSNAGLDVPGNEEDPDWESGCIFGSGIAGAEVMRDATYLIDEGRVKRLGSGAVSQVMASGISAYLGGRFGLGNRVSSNASACATGTESLLLAAEHIRSGAATRMICGACDSGGPYAWGGFDAMRVTNRRSNEAPEAASRPLSATAAGFVPGCGAGALVCEELESAIQRGATIHAEVLGGAINSGGQRKGGSMTAANKEGIVRCIRHAVENAGIHPREIDAISGHLTATLFDPIEIEQWSVALERSGSQFPYVNSLKSMVGHCLSASGAIEIIAAILQIKGEWLHGSLNCENLHPKIAECIDPERVPQTFRKHAVRTLAKSSFGFGDVNTCAILRRYDPE